MYLATAIICCELCCCIRVQSVTLVTELAGGRAHLHASVYDFCVYAQEREGGGPFSSSSSAFSFSFCVSVVFLFGFCFFVFLHFGFYSAFPVELA